MMMTQTMMILTLLAMIAVLGVLGLGVYAMMKGGEFNKKYGNTLMRARVILQGLAFALFALAYLSSGH